MAFDINRVQLLGYLGRDPEVKTMGQYEFVTISIATKRSWVDKTTKERREETEWHRCTAMGDSMKKLAKNLKKGTRLLVEGRLRTRSWDKNGEKRYATEIVLEGIYFMAGRDKPDAARAGNAADDDDVPF